VFRWWYIEVVQTDGPAPPGFTQDLKADAMTLSHIERQADRFAPVALLLIGLFTAFSTAGLGI
jgi:hypothetical protein